MSAHTDEGASSSKVVAAARQFAADSPRDTLNGTQTLNSSLFVSSADGDDAGSDVYSRGDSSGEEDDDEDAVMNSSELRLHDSVMAGVTPHVSPVAAAKPPLTLDTTLGSDGGPSDAAPSTRNLVTSAGRRPAAKFRARPPATFVSPAEFRQTLAGLRVKLGGGAGGDDTGNWYAMLRRFDTADDGRVNLSEFWAVIADFMSPGVSYWEGREGA